MRHTDLRAHPLPRWQRWFRPRTFEAVAPFRPGQETSFDLHFPATVQRLVIENADGVALYEQALGQFVDVDDEIDFRFNVEEPSWIGELIVSQDQQGIHITQADETILMSLPFLRTLRKHGAKGVSWNGDIITFHVVEGDFRYQVTRETDPDWHGVYAYRIDDREKAQ